MYNNYELFLEGDNITLMERRPVKTVSAESFLATLNKDREVETPLLPVGCRYLIRNDRSTVVVVESSPRRASISLQGLREPFSVSLPFLQLYAQVHEGQRSTSPGYLYVSATKTPIQTVDDQVWISPLPNTYSSGRICNSSYPSMEYPSMLAAVRQMITTYFGTVFNNDLGINFPTVSPIVGGNSTRTLVNAVTEWARLSEEDSFFALSEKTEYAELSPRRTFQQLARSALEASR